MVVLTHYIWCCWQLKWTIQLWGVIGFIRKLSNIPWCCIILNPSDCPVFDWLCCFSCCSNRCLYFPIILISTFCFQFSVLLHCIFSFLILLFFPLFFCESNFFFLVSSFFLFVPSLFLSRCLSVFPWLLTHFLSLCACCALGLCFCSYLLLPLLMIAQLLTISPPIRAWAFLLPILLSLSPVSTLSPLLVLGLHGRWVRIEEQEMSQV